MILSIEIPFSFLRTISIHKKTLSPCNSWLPAPADYLFRQCVCMEQHFLASSLACIVFRLYSFFFIDFGRVSRYIGMIVILPWLARKKSWLELGLPWVDVLDYSFCIIKFIEINKKQQLPTINKKSKLMYK